MHLNLVAMARIISHMKKPALLLGPAVILALGYAGYWYYSTAALAGYTNKNIDMTAVDAAAGNPCPDSEGHARLLCLAGALKGSLTPELQAKLQLPYSTADAKRWSNFPPAGYRDRVGPTLGEFSAPQLTLAKALLKEAAGIAKGEGYDEMEQILNADDYLAANAENTAGFASGNFHLAFLGEPAETGTWELYFGGHHLAFANTFKDGKLTGTTPSFRGVEPFTAFTQNGRDNAPMVEEQAAFAAMLTGLGSEEQAKAKLSQTFTNIVVGPQQDGAFPQVRDGQRVGDLTPEKQALVIKAIETYVMDIDPPDAEAIMAAYKAELGETFIAFSGTPVLNTENDYVRIDGPSVWIEFSMQPGRSLPGIHPHSVWRDRKADYGGNP